jgi:uncharacterized protein YegJ (DUF2314 family)
MSLQRLLPALCFLLLSFTACQEHTNEKLSAEQNTYITDSVDVMMNTAMDIARRRFGAFDSAFESRKYDSDKFSIKVKFPHPRGNEYIWLVNISKVNGQYFGIVSDTPRATTIVKYGDRPAIATKDVVDWLYGKDSVMHGGYTMRVIFGRLTKEELARQRVDFPYKIVD